MVKEYRTDKGEFLSISHSFLEKLLGREFSRKIVTIERPSKEVQDKMHELLSKKEKEMLKGDNENIGKYLMINENYEIFVEENPRKLLKKCGGKYCTMGRVGLPIYKI